MTALGKLKTKLWRKPLKHLAAMARWGPVTYLKCGGWQHEMALAASMLPSTEELYLHPEYPGPGSQPNHAGAGRRHHDVWFMTGSTHWYQTAFCAWSFALHSGLVIRPIILDDGTLLASHIDHLKRLFPELVVHSVRECDEQFFSLFPAKKYPSLNFMRWKQLLFRKLTDIHAHSDERRLFFDSDMIFFRRPAQLETYMLSTSSTPIVQKDCWESYGYTRELTERLCGARLPDAANIGIFSLNGSTIDWEKVENWLTILLEEQRTKYNVTQCITAMLIAAQSPIFLDANEYNVLPITPGKARPLRVLEHYVSDSKPYYFSRAWKELVGAC